MGRTQAPATGQLGSTWQVNVNKNRHLTCVYVYIYIYYIIHIILNILYIRMILYMYTICVPLRRNKCICTWMSMSMSMYMCIWIWSQIRCVFNRRKHRDFVAKSYKILQVVSIHFLFFFRKLLSTGEGNPPLYQSLEDT